MRLAFDLGLNVAWPLLVFNRAPAGFTPVQILLLALVGPVLAATITIVKQRRISGLTALALIGVGISGGIGALSLDSRWFAVKEAVIPGLIGALTAVSASTRHSLVRTVFHELLDRAKLDAALVARNEVAGADAAMRRATLRLGGLWVALGLASGVLAARMVNAAAGSEVYVAQLGSYTGWSFVAINLPLMAAMVWVLQKAIDEVAALSGIPIDDLIKP